MGRGSSRVQLLVGQVAEESGSLLHYEFEVSLPHSYRTKIISRSFFGYHLIYGDKIEDM